MRGLPRRDLVGRPARSSRRGSRTDRAGAPQPFERAWKGTPERLGRFAPDPWRRSRGRRARSGHGRRRPAGLDLPPLRWIVPDLIPEGTTILAAPPKVGKCCLVYQIAVEAVDRWRPARPARRAGQRPVPRARGRQASRPGPAPGGARRPDDAPRSARGPLGARSDRRRSRGGHRRLARRPPGRRARGDRHARQGARRAATGGATPTRSTSRPSGDSRTCSATGRWRWSSSTTPARSRPTTS